MASIHLQGILVDSVGEIDVGGVITFTHLTTTGDTIASTQTELIIPPDGAYSIDVEYGQIRIDYTTRNTERFVANVIVNSASTATSLPELLSATTPVAKPVIIQMQGLVADAVTAKTGSELAETGAVAAEAGAVAAAADIVNIRRETVHNISTLTDAVANTDIAVGDSINLAERTAGNGGGAMWDVVLASGATANTFNIVACTGIPTLALVLRVDGVINPRQWGVIGNGVTNDRTTLANMLGALTHGAVVDWSGLTYHLGEITTLTVDGSNPMFLIDNVQGLKFINRPTFKITQNITVPTTYLQWDDVFQFKNCSNLEFVGKLIGDTYDLTYPNGMCLVSLITGTIDGTQIHIDAEAENCLSPFMTNKDGAAEYRQISFIAKGKNVTYATRLVDAGFDVDGVVFAEEHARSFFCTGVKNVNVDVQSLNQRKIDDVLIKSYNSSVSNIRVRLNQRGSTGTEWPVAIEFQNDLQNTSIKNIDIDIQSDRAPVSGFEELVVFTQRNGSGTPVASSASEIDNISITTQYRQNADFHAVFTSRTQWTNAKQLITNCPAALIDSFGFTVLRGDKYSVKFRGGYDTNSLGIYITPQVYASVNMFKLKVWGTPDYGSLLSTNGFYKELILHIPLTLSGNGTVYTKATILDIVGGIVSPNVFFTMTDGVLNVQTGADDDYQLGSSELCASLEILSSL